MSLTGIAATLEPGDRVRLRIRLILRVPSCVFEGEAVWLGALAATYFLWILGEVPSGICSTPVGEVYRGHVKASVPDATFDDVARLCHYDRTCTDILWKSDPARTRKYPHECPCGILAVHCEYHRDA